VGIEEKKDSNGVLEQGSNGTDQENIDQNKNIEQNSATVKLESYQKLKRSFEKEKALNQDIAKKLASREKVELEQQGKFKELLEIETKRSEDFEEKFKNSVSRTAKFSVTSKIKEIAAREGCVNTEDLVLLCDLNSFDYDDDFQVNEQQVKELVDKFKKDKPYFFNIKAPNIQEGILRPPDGQSSYEDEIQKATTQKEFDAIRKKFNRI